jgi:hypothetical protein
MHDHILVCVPSIYIYIHIYNTGRQCNSSKEPESGADLSLIAGLARFLLAIGALEEKLYKLTPPWSGLDVVGGLLTIGVSTSLTRYI